MAGNITFEEAIRAAFNSWSTLQFLLEKDTNDIGRQFEEFLIEFTVEVFRDNDALELTDVEVGDQLYNVIKRDFDVQIDDQSEDDVATFIVKAHKLIKCHRFDELRMEVDKLPACNTSNFQNKSAATENDEDGSSSDESESGEEENVITNIASSMSKSRINEPDEDGWVTIGKKH